MNYKVKNNTYIAENGYVFKNKINNNTCKGLKLGINDTIENYEIVEEPEEETNEENAKNQGI